MTGRGTLRPPCVIHEDEHLLGVVKPAGWNTHAPAPYAGEGLHEWLRDREPRWASLAIVHRLDRDTSGVMVFARTAQASRDLAAQFAARAVRKVYVLLTDRAVPPAGLRVESSLRRAGNRYVTAQPTPDAVPAVTIFRPAGRGPAGTRRVEAEPLTGRTHQIRAQAAASGFPVLGDRLYGGAPAPRLCLHAALLSFRHPATGAPCTLDAQPDFAADPAAALRAAVIDPAETSAWREVHGAPDGWPRCYVERLGAYLLMQTDTEPDAAGIERLRRMGARGVYHKRLARDVRRLAAAEAAPRLVAGAGAEERFGVVENGVHFELGLAEGYSYGLFLDQRDNRRRFLTGHVAAGFDLPVQAAGRAAPELLNLFAYTCGFSVCAALGGMRATSVDLSKKYLDWGRRNFALNGLDPAGHDFIYGDAFDWLRRLERKGRRFDAVALDPPTFSQSRAGGRFQAERDYGRLVTAALAVLRPGGVLFASSNAARLPAAKFVGVATAAIAAAGRGTTATHYAPQPPDFPVGHGEPAYLKTWWARIS